MIKKITLFLSVLLFASIIGSPVDAKNNNRPSTLPADAIEIAPGVFSLGKAKDPKTGKIVDGIAFVHYKKEETRSNNAKPSKGVTQCYGFISKGAKWKTEENWVINANNNSGLDKNILLNIVRDSIDKWENAAGNTGVLGQGELVDGDLGAGDYYNNANEVEFNDLGSANTIAITTIWGYFSGPVFTREILEWDMEFNTQFQWSAGESGVAGKMDFDNIATHELGHAFGLADLYTSSCNQETMFGYAGEGETNKRDLNTGDIKGIRELYIL
ncbi:MAG: matrixin family metalloprotease [Patescibacteria group bacterium]